MTPRTETVAVSHYLCDTPVITGPVADTLVRSLRLDRPRDLKAERDYAATEDEGYITLPAGCSIPKPDPAPTADELNSIWAELAPHPLDGFGRLLRDTAP
ncbi:hypothetical protein SGL43_06641 [Streptomyces globisporus]|uniref:Uncharacterized protein n=1 Tax=Streptomyces globisporus TaxID=1908 RepID=A0ABN8VIS3_STRGL|nr:hypothetical protein [Streptomyces globisporus]CAH9419586.1 hypothetical protein SGL43_06641 [Streptomyces globisporus]